MKLINVNYSGLRFLFLFFLLGCAIGLKAQFRYVPGFIVKNSSDTLHGYIHSRSLISGTRLCRFKKNRQDETKQFLPFEIKSYGSDSIHFEARREYLRKEKKVSNSEFYKLIFDGKLDILIGKGSRFYIGTDTSRLIYFLNRKDFLYYLTGDQPELRKQIKEMRFSENSFVDLMTRYHTSLNLNYIVNLPRNSVTSLDFYLLSGYNLSFLKTQSESVKPVNYNASYSPMFGYGIDFFPSFRGGRGNFSFNLQNRFIKELFQSQTISESGTSVTYNDVLFEGYVIDVPLGLKFHKRVKKDLKVYIMPGAIWKKYIAREARVITDYVYNDEVTTYLLDLDYYAQSTISFFLSAGVEKKFTNKNKLFVDLNMDHAGSNTFQRYSLSLSIGYKILHHVFDN